MKIQIGHAGLLMVFAILSCGNPRYLYSPIEINNPDFTGEKQVFLAANATGGLISTGNAGNKSRNGGAGIQGGVSLVKGFTLHGQYSYRGERGGYNWDIGGERLNSSVQYERSLWEAGLGYFTELDRNKTGFFSFYAGLGSARSNLQDRLTDDMGGVRPTLFHHSSVKRFYLQPSLNFHPSTYFNAGLSLKWNALTFRDFNTTYTPTQLQSLDIFDVEGKTFGQMEAGFQATAYLPGSPNLGIRLMGHTLLGTHSSFESRTTFVSIGIAYVAGKRHNRAKQ